MKLGHLSRIIFCMLVKGMYDTHPVVIDQPPSGSNASPRRDDVSATDWLTAPITRATLPSKFVVSPVEFKDDEL
jgi:hypothetical protein